MSEPDGEQPPADAPAAAPVGIVGTAGDTHAAYLTKCLVADKGYVPGTFPEAAPLADASDYVVTGGDGVGLSIACIIDRDRDPSRRFTLEPARVDEIAAACRHHAGSVHGVRDTVTVEIWEVGAGVPDAADRARFEGYTFRPLTQKGVGVKTYAVDTAPGTLGDLVSTAADGTARQPWVRKVLKEPRRSNAELARSVEQREKVARFHTRPVATFGLLAAFAIVFIVSLVWTVVPADGFLSPHIGTLIAHGALDHTRVEGGEWWRLLTCAFLHGSLMHILFNGVAMFMAGGVLENLVGRAWMLALFVVGALGGSAASLTINPAHVASVGASGAIMALLAAAMVISMRLPKGAGRSQILVSLGYILVPSLLPLAEGNTDYAAHIGGAITGAICGALILFTWRRDAAAPRLPKLAAAIAAAGLLVTAFGFVRAAMKHDEVAATFRLLRADPETLALLVPDDKNPGTDEAWKAAAPDLLTSYPRDPRVLYMVAERAIDARDLDTARTYLDRILAEPKLVRLVFGENSQFDAIVRYRLANIYEHDQNLPMVPATLLPACPTGKSFPDPDVSAYYRRNCVVP